jgi:hypothetical protein
MWRFLEISIESPAGSITFSDLPPPKFVKKCRFHILPDAVPSAPSSNGRFLRADEMAELAANAQTFRIRRSEWLSLVLRHDAPKTSDATLPPGGPFSNAFP